jgi:CRP/FNR family transcriptional regulator, cyclic AMP receptor protein
LTTHPPEIRLDVRSIPTWDRHARVFALFDALGPDQVLVLISDHEPRPLRGELERTRGDRHVWTQRQLGDGRWEVELRKVGAIGGGDIATTIATSAVFSTASPAGIEQLSERAQRVTVKRSHSVVEQGVAWPYIAILEHGAVQAVLRTDSGREQAMYDVLAGDVIGEIPLFDGGVTTLRYVAVASETTAVLIPIETVRLVMAAERSVAAALEQMTAQRFRTVFEDIATTLSRPAQARVAQTLLNFASPDAGLAPALASLRDLTQTDIAARAGTVKEVVNRALAELEAAGAVERSAGRIVRLDRAKLAQAADVRSA